MYIHLLNIYNIPGVIDLICSYFNYFNGHLVLYFISFRILLKTIWGQVYGIVDYTWTNTNEKYYTNANNDTTTEGE